MDDRTGQLKAPANKSRYVKVTGARASTVSNLSDQRAKFFARKKSVIPFRFLTGLVVVPFINGLYIKIIVLSIALSMDLFLYVLKYSPNVLNLYYMRALSKMDSSTDIEYRDTILYRVTRTLSLYVWVNTIWLLYTLCMLIRPSIVSKIAAHIPAGVILTLNADVANYISLFSNVLPFFEESKSDGGLEQVALFSALLVSFCVINIFTRLNTISELAVKHILNTRVRDPASSLSRIRKFALIRITAAGPACGIAIFMLKVQFLAKSPINNVPFQSYSLYDDVPFFMGGLATFVILFSIGEFLADMLVLESTLRCNTAMLNDTNTNISNI